MVVYSESTNGLDVATHHVMLGPLARRASCHMASKLQEEYSAHCQL